MELATDGINTQVTSTPVATFNLTEIATNIYGIRLIGREGGNVQGFVGVFNALRE